MKHIAVLVKNLMYKGCEPHWGCVICSECVPLHCYTQEEFEEKECKGLKPLTFTPPNKPLARKIREEKNNEID